jgi:hypothetical protein
MAGKRGERWRNDLSRDDMYDYGRSMVAVRPHGRAGLEVRLGQERSVASRPEPPGYGAAVVLGGRWHQLTKEPVRCLLARVSSSTGGSASPRRLGDELLATRTAGNSGRQVGTVVQAWRFGPSPVSQRRGGRGETGDARSTYAAKRPVFSVRTPRASSNDVRT